MRIEALKNWVTTRRVERGCKPSLAGSPRVRYQRATAAICLAVMAVTLGTVRTVAAGGAVITEYLAGQFNIPNGITAGPDGNLWVVNGGTDSLIKMSPSGVILATYQLPSKQPRPTGSGPESLKIGPDRAIWFVEDSASMIGRISTTGSLQEIQLPQPAPCGNGAPLTDSWFPDSLTVGPDGNIWFAGRCDVIGRVLTAAPHTVTLFPIPGGIVFGGNQINPNSIVVGQDGLLWFTEGQFSAIGRIDTAGVFSSAISLPFEFPANLIVDKSGVLWASGFNVTVGNGNLVARISVNGGVRVFPVRTGPCGMAFDPDGNLWASTCDDFVYRLTPATGVITTVPMPSGCGGGCSTTDSITRGPSSDPMTMWFTEISNGAVARIDLGIADDVQPIGRHLSLKASAPTHVPVATFTDNDASAATPFTASIDWGDGSSSAGVVKGDGSFVVFGSHAYVQRGSYTITVTVTDTDGLTGTALSTARVR